MRRAAPPFSDFPSKVRILGLTFDVHYVSHIGSKEDDFAGECDCSASVIRIHRDQSRDAMRDTLVHEIAHAVYRYLMSDLDDQDAVEEERIVLFAAQVVHQCLDALGTDFFC